MKNSTYWLLEKAQSDLLAYLNKTCGIGKTDGHYRLKTSDRGANPAHCREVCILAAGLDAESVKTLSGKYGKTMSQLLHIATGRPRKNSRASDKHLAAESAGNILRDLRKLSGLPVGNVGYKPGRIKAPESAEVLKDLIAQADQFNAEFEAEIVAAEKPKPKRRAPRTRKPKAKPAVKKATVTKAVKKTA